jgi:hypothetical protein
LEQRANRTGEGFLEEERLKMDISRDFTCLDFGIRGLLGSSSISSITISCVSQLRMGPKIINDL